MDHKKVNHNNINNNQKIIKPNPNTIDLTNNESYIKSCLEICEKKISKFKTIEDIKQNEDDINIYDNINNLTEPKNVFILDKISENEILRAKKCILDGKFFAEHTAAGEATRLGLGTKYLINIAKELSAEKIAKMISEEKNSHFSTDSVIAEASCKPNEILPISLGTRHMLQYSFDIHKLAIKHNLDPLAVLKKQKMLVILNETTGEQILSEFQENNFFGFCPENVLFMIQKSYHGISIKEGKFVYDVSSPKRLHNHGQMVMQETMDDEIFYLTPENYSHENTIKKKPNGEKISYKKHFLKAEEFGAILKQMENKQSLNIEDLEFLTQAIDYKSLAMTLTMADQGINMVMEIVANNPITPQKGGMAAFNTVLDRNVMIESFQLKGIKNADIKFLNKNFNQYPNPYKSWKLLKEKGLNMPISIKNGFIYFQPIQGDINFLVKTQFVQRKILKPIKAWKSAATTPLTINYMKKQDEQVGFIDYAKKFVQI